MGPKKDPVPILASPPKKIVQKVILK